MYNNQRIMALIPARGGSKGIKNRGVARSVQQPLSFIPSPSWPVPAGYVHISWFSYFPIDSHGLRSRQSRKAGGFCFSVFRCPKEPVPSPESFPPSGRFPPLFLQFAAANYSERFLFSQSSLFYHRPCGFLLHILSFLRTAPSWPSSVLRFLSCFPAFSCSRLSLSYPSP